MHKIPYFVEREESQLGYKFDVDTGCVVDSTKYSNVITLYGNKPLAIPIYYLIAYGSEDLQNLFNHLSEVKEDTDGDIEMTTNQLKEVASIKSRLDYSNSL
jgi:hypothetical protein